MHAKGQFNAALWERTVRHLGKRQPMTDTKAAPSTFEPDWDEIYNAWLQPDDDEYNRSYALPLVIAEYQRQLAEAGYVVVRREDLRSAIFHARGADFLDDRSKKMLDRLDAMLD